MAELNGETATIIVILLATIGLLILNKMKQSKALRAKLSETLEDIEDAIESATGLDVELNEVVEEISDAAESVLEDLKEDGDLDSSLEEVVEDVKESVEKVADDVVADIVDDLNENLEATLGGMTVNALKDMLRERNLPVSGKKAELIERLINE